MAQVVPEGFVTLREAIKTVARARLAGRELSDDAKYARSLGLQQEFSCAELQEAADALWTRVDGARLQIWAEHPKHNDRIRIAAELLDFFGVRRFSVSNLHFLRPPHRLALLLAARFGPSWRETQLLVDAADTERVGKEERRKRKRQETSTTSTRGVGRPSKLQSIKKAVAEVVESGKWHGGESLKKLTTILQRPPYSHSISDTSVARALDNLQEETGDRRFERMRKASRTVSAEPVSASSPNARL